MTDQPKNKNLRGGPREGVLLRLEAEDADKAPLIYWIPMGAMERLTVTESNGTVTNADADPAVHQELNVPGNQLRGVLNAIRIGNDGKWASGK